MNKTCVVGLALALNATIVCAGGWEYSTETDEMTDKRVTWAKVTSSNSLSLKFPYQGKNEADLFIKRTEGASTYVLIRLKKGQILKYPALVRFDEDEAIELASFPLENDPTVAALGGPTIFIDHAKTAKAIRVQLWFYQDGKQVLRFETPTPLKW